MTHVPDRWVEIDLEGALAELEDGRILHQGWSPQCEKQPSDSPDVWGVLKTTAIQAGRFAPEHNKRLPDGLSPRPLLEVREGDVLITSAGPRARCGVSCLVRNVRPNLMISGKMYRFRLNDELVDSRYAEAYLQSDSAVRAIDTMKTGISDSGLNLTHARFRKLRLPLAPRLEQERIMSAIEELFSRLAAAERSLENARSRVSAYVASAVAESLSGDWPVVCLGDVTEDQRYGTSTRTNSDSTGTPVLRMGNIQNGQLDFSKLKYLPHSHPELENLTLRAGDLLFNRTNSPELVGKSAVFKGSGESVSFASYLIRVRLTPECDPDWANLVLNSPLGRAYIARVRTQQVGQANVNGTKLAAAPIPLPPLHEQVQILRSMDRHQSIATAVTASLELAQRRSAMLRRAILNHAFRGNLAQGEATDEPAAELLNRIVATRDGDRSKRGRRVSA